MRMGFDVMGSYKHQEGVASYPMGKCRTKAGNPSRKIEGRGFHRRDRGERRCTVGRH